jgi:hypothetical protein
MFYYNAILNIKSQKTRKCCMNDFIMVYTSALGIECCFEAIVFLVARHLLPKQRLYF